MNVSSLKDNQKDELAKLLYKYQFFSSYQKSDFERIVHAFSFREFDSGETIFKKGSKASGIYIISKGRIEVVARKGLSLFSSKVAELGPGDCFGEMSLIDHTAHQGTVNALSPVSVFVLESSDFDSFFEDNPSFKDALRKLAASRR